MNFNLNFNLNRSNFQIQIFADSTTVVPSGRRGRKSVRLESKNQFDEGLFIFDLDHLPTGQGTWPAYWLSGEDWPNNGEIDILEGVDGKTFNSITLHSKDGCRMAEGDSSLFTGRWAKGTSGLATNCFVRAPSN